MKYELAKRLKDAGFPQLYPEEPPILRVYLSPQKKIVNGKPEHTLSKELAYAPPLEELIEACGKTLFGELSPFKDEWRVMGGQHVYDDDFHEMQYEYVLFGSTPAEAVANLWLALNLIKQ